MSLRKSHVPPPLGLLAEITNRCPLQCPYCSNPLDLIKADRELDLADWNSVFDQAARLGVLQIHLSGGEPLVRRDLEKMVGTCAEHGLYTNLITSAVGLSQDRLAGLVEAGLDHVQISFQSLRPERAFDLSQHKDGLEKKLDAVRLVKEAGLPWTLNVPFHRRNLIELEDFIEIGVTHGAHRIEIAQVQYYGWALLNRALLMPTFEQVTRAVDIVDAARVRLRGIINIDHVVTDYYAKYPKPCMGGWGAEVMNVTADGRVLPCHGAVTIPEMVFDRVTDRPLEEIWQTGAAFEKFRGFDWMSEPCRSCDRRELDFGGCRCQAMALAGDASLTDPACSLSPHHDRMVETALAESAGNDELPFQYRRI